MAKGNKEVIKTVAFKMSAQAMKEFKAICKARGGTVSTELRRFILSEIVRAKAEKDPAPKKKAKKGSFGGGPGACGY